MDPFKPYQPKPKAPSPTLLTPDSAEAVALQALAFIAEDEELLARFIALSGCGADDIRLRIGDRNFLTGVLDFILADEPTVLAFANHGHLTSELPLRARQVLSGDEG